LNDIHGRVAVKMPFLRKGNRVKGCGMLNVTRTGLKISGNWSYGGMNPPQRRTEQKAANTPQRDLECPSRSLENYS